MKKQVKLIVINVAYHINVWWWFLSRPTTCGAKCVILYKDQLLLVRPAYGHKLWMIPGGGVKSKETFIEGATRELKEETGLELNLTFFYQYQQVREYKHDTVQCFYGQVDVSTIVIDNFEIIEYGWFALDALPQQRSASVDKIINALPVL